MSAWQTLETEDEMPPVRVFSRAELDVLARSSRRGGRGRPLIGRQEREAIVEKYLEGMGMTKLEVEFHRGYATLRRVLDDAGVIRGRTRG